MWDYHICYTHRDLWGTTGVLTEWGLSNGIKSGEAMNDHMQMPIKPWCHNTRVSVFKCFYLNFIPCVRVYFLSTSAFKSVCLWSESNYLGFGGIELSMTGMFKSNLKKLCCVIKLSIRAKKYHIPLQIKEIPDTFQLYRPFIFSPLDW